MSLNGAVNPSNNAFAGGARFGLGNPVGRSGTLPPASTGVSSPAAGVSGGNPAFARQNRGSNVRIPYSRLVSVSDISKALPSSGNTALANYKKLINANGPDTQALVMESEDLSTGRIAFIKGHRSGGMPPAMKVKFTGVNESEPNTYRVDRMRGSFNRFQALCSIEYLARMYAVVFRRAKILLGEPLISEPFGEDNLEKYETGLLRDFKDHMKEGTTTLANIPDFLSKPLVDKEVKESMDAWNENFPAATDDEKNDAVLLYTQQAQEKYAKRQGIFARDIHPFLRGKCLETNMVDVEKPAHNAAVFRVSRSTGDNYAFAALEHAMAKMGLTDWRPDGVVLGKDHAGPDDESDHSYDSRLGQLFNVVVQGPAICTNFVGDFKLAPMVGDRVFVLVLCDVIFDKKAFDATEHPRRFAADFEDVIENILEAAKEEREKALNDFVPRQWKQLAEEAFKQKAGTRDMLCNFRIKVSTSAEMINYSGVNAEKVDAMAIAGTDDRYKIPEDQRMGLKLGSTMGEYIVGGWCMGTVLDSAASRAALPGMFSSKNDVSSYALNVAVNVEWWSGDRLYRNYCDIEKQLVGRHNKPTEDKYTLEWSYKAGERTDDDFK